ncbi:hypothetical protein SMSP2_01536 [Limihaloglobus sulfuriphilus]|uniref:Uncharacterized protein n=1 Tax=Limihaloglobus sulfuriphilus TaxID=1851148 RepID=A0A1Q2MES6_9BACT|nr:hypothetical protein [Limihaloglobus sulfuriphilus]AQQ71170.1 hypothetical protein SMSP2_01536 [Limihaloglobus sulfuriphilus]
MFLFWNIRYFDSRDKKYKDRGLSLDTGTLDLPTRLAIEAVYETKESSYNREFLRWRQLFSECNLEDISSSHGHYNNIGSIFIIDYFEDENGNEITLSEISRITSGDANSIIFPAGTPPHYVEYALSPDKKLNISDLSFNQEEIKALAYFKRDLDNLIQTAFFKERSPATLSSTSNQFKLTTSVTEEEIKSFILVYRRFYMVSEPYNFNKTVELFCEKLPSHPLIKWIRATEQEYLHHLDNIPSFTPQTNNSQISFKVKRLIDVFLYTQYVHQPDERRARQYAECLAVLNRNEDYLLWLFLSEIKISAIHIYNAGKCIVGVFNRYCKENVISNAIVDIVSSGSGIGSQEKQAHKEQRIFTAKVEELAEHLWREDGCPEVGTRFYRKQAEEQLRKLLKEHK